MDQKSIHELLEAVKQTPTSNHQQLGSLYFQLSNPDLYNKKNEGLQYVDDAVKHASLANDLATKYKAIANKLRIYYYLQQSSNGQEVVQTLKNEYHHYKSDPFIVMYVCNVIAAFNNQMSFYKEALDIYNLVTPYHLDNADDLMLANMHNCKAVAYERLYDKVNSFDNFMKALNIHQKTNNIKGQAQVYYNISGLYEINGDEGHKAAEYLTKSLALNRQINRMYGIYNCLINKLNYTIPFGEAEEALANLQELEGIAPQIDKDYLCEVYSYYAKYYIHYNQYERALEYLDRIYSEGINFENTAEILVEKSHRGLCYEAMNEYDKAAKVYREAHELLQHLEYPKMKIELYHQMYQFYKRLGSFDEALTYLELKTEESTRFLKDEQSRAMAAMQTQFETAEKEKEIKSLKLEKVSLNLQSLRSQMNPHFVFNAINSISNSFGENSTEKSQKLLQSFARLMRSNLNFAELDKITLEEEIQFLQDYLSVEQSRLNNRFTFNIEVSENIDLDFTKIPSMLVQPYVENAVKHGVKEISNSKIHITFRETDDYLVCTIIDNGIGVEAATLKKKALEKHHESKATNITQKRLQLLNQNLESPVTVSYALAYPNQTNVGTKVEMQIPLF